MATEATLLIDYVAENKCHVSWYSLQVMPSHGLQFQTEELNEAWVYLLNTTRYHPVVHQRM